MTTDTKDFLADLVTEPKWASTVLQRLFSRPAGHWTSVEELCRIPDQPEHVNQLHVPESSKEIMTTWLPYPNNTTNDNLIVFYNNLEMSITCSIVTNLYLRKFFVVE